MYLVDICHSYYRFFPRLGRPPLKGLPLALKRGDRRPLRFHPNLNFRLSGAVAPGTGSIFPHLGQRRTLCHHLTLTALRLTLEMLHVDICSPHCGQIIVTLFDLLSWAASVHKCQDRDESGSEDTNASTLSPSLEGC
jgi:hypothetical protein